MVVRVCVCVYVCLAVEGGKEEDWGILFVCFALQTCPRAD